MSIPAPEPAAAGPTGLVEMPPDPPPPPIGPPPMVAPYQAPPPYPPPGLRRGTPTDGRAIISLAASIVGILLGVPFGLPGLALGPFAYFMGRSALARIDSAPGVAGGRSLAGAGSVLGIVATAIGAVVSLIWLVLLLVTTPPAFE